MRDPLNASVQKELIEQVDRAVKESRGQYQTRSHFVQLALQEKLERIKKEMVK